MRDKVKRFISILMTALMLVNLLPVGALADGITSIGYKPETVANGNQTVYLYVKVTGNLNGLNLNKSGWCTVGKVTGLNMTDPQSYAWWYGSSNHVSSVSGISASSVGKGDVERYEKNQSIDLSKVTWASGTHYGFLPVSTGADDYVGSGWTWHLDGYIDIAQVQASYKIRYVDQDTNNVLKIAASGTDDPGVWIDHSAPKKLDGGYEIVGDTDRTFKLEQIDNTFDIYYRRPYGYTVEYYYDDVKDEDATVIGERQMCGTKINTYTPKSKVGYELDETKTTKLPLTIGTDESKNVIKVYYKKIGYTVTYEPGDYGAFEAEDHTYIRHYNDPTPAYDEENPTAIPDGKPGWTFAGWEPKVDKTVTKNAEYVAQWKEKEVAVTYEAEYGGKTESLPTSPQKITAFSAENLKAVPAPNKSREGYAFIGWFKGDDPNPLEMKVELSKETAEANLNKDDNALYTATTFTAKYAPMTSEVKYIVEKDGVQDETPISIQTISVIDGEPLENVTANPIEGYTFDGWYLHTDRIAEGSTLEAATAKGKLHRVNDLYADTTFTAKFVPDKTKTATVLCTIDEKQIGYGTVYPSIYQTILQATGKLDGGGSVSGSTATANKGYKFVCWYKVTGEDTYEKVTDDPELKSELAESKLNRDEKTGLYQNTVFKAWFELDAGAKVPVTYEAENGTLEGTTSQEAQVVTGEGLTDVEATPNKGYKFDGWYNGDERITTDLTLTPEMAKDNLDKDENGLYVNTTFTAKCVPDENQHAAVIYAIFRGQSDYGFIAPSAQQIILQATGKQANGKPVSGSTATAKPGYKFVGWYKVTGWTTEWQTEWITNSPELTPELAEKNLIRNEQGLYQNTVFAAKFELDENNQAEVIYQVENGTILNTSGSTSISQFVQVVTGEVLTDVTATPNPGYKFNGWYKGDECITTDLTLTPKMAKDKLDKDENGLYVNTTFTAKCVPDEDQHATVIYTIDETQRGYGSVVPSIIEIILQATGKQANGNPISGSMATANKGYKFVGWYKVTGEATYEKVTDDPKLTSELAESELNRDEKTGLYRNTVFEARFELDAGAKVPVTYEAENGTLEGTTSQEAHIVTGDGLTDVEATPNKGYKFDGWYNGDERITTDLTLTPEKAKEKLNKDENGLYVNTTFTAKCVLDEDQNATVTYTIFHGQSDYGSIAPSAQQVILQATGKQANGDPISGSTATAKPGYKFVGWYKVTGWTTEWQTEWITDKPELTPEVAEQNLTQNEQGLYQNTVFAAKFELNDYAYTVEHYWIGDKDNPDAQPFHTDADEIQTAPYGSTVKYEENGASWVIMTNPVYTFAKADPEKITISADASQNVLKLYYYKNVKLTANSETNPYNGKEQHVSGYTCAVAEMKDGSVEYVPWTGEKPLTFEGISASGRGKDVNENGYPVTFNDTPIGENNGLYYVIESQTGTLTIAPAPVTLQAPIASKTYDGTPLKAEDYGHSFVEGVDFADDFASISVEGSQTQAGSSVSQIKEVVPKKGKDLKNYKLTFLPGSLTVTKRSVLLTSQSATKTYDGSALTRPAVTITGDGFVPGELAKVEATGSITNVGSTPNAIQYTTTGAFNPANYSIALSVGTLTVTAKPEPEPRRTFNLTVNYVYQNGKRAAASYNRGGLKNGETFDITSPVIAGYTASETVVSGTIDNRDIKVTVIYTADGVNLDDYGVPLGLGNITMNVGDCFE